jgi:CDP-6-deoxy-D-xylo-4-hexulose-3-dehydrase
MAAIRALCKQFEVLLLEDSCESVASTYDGVKTGNFGLASTFSMYYGHFFSSFEGGIVSTNDTALYQVLRSIRSNGWDRELSASEQQRLRFAWNVDEFKALYTFYYTGFNFRPTDLQGFVALRQMPKFARFAQARICNLHLYHEKIANPEWKLKVTDLELNRTVVNFSYPVITSKIQSVVEELKKANVETRPLICGSMGRQPFFIKYWGKPVVLPNADRIHECGLYLPNNPELTEEEITAVCEAVNRGIEK